MQTLLCWKSTLNHIALSNYLLHIRITSFRSISAANTHSSLPLFLFIIIILLLITTHTSHITPPYSHHPLSFLTGPISDDPEAEVRQLRGLVVLMNNRIAELQQVGGGSSSSSSGGISNSQGKRAKIEPTASNYKVPAQVAATSAAAAAPGEDILLNVDTDL